MHLKFVISTVFRLLAMFADFQKFIWVLGLVLPGVVQAQGALGCDEGVVRLPDRSGTVQICSSMAAKVPQLAKQLTEVTRLLGDQQKQLAELARLTRSINAVSRGIGADNQQGLLQSLSDMIARAEKSGDQGTTFAVSNLIDRFDRLEQRLRSQAMETLDSPSGFSTLSAGLKGPLGRSIARLDFDGADAELDAIREELNQIRGQLTDVKADTGAIRQQTASIDARTQNIEASLSDIASRFASLGANGGLVANARTAEEHYYNAIVYEQRGNLRAALDSYKAYFATGANFVDPVERYVRLVTASQGTAAANEALNEAYQINRGTAVAFYRLTLGAPRDNLKALEELSKKERGFSVASYLMGIQLDESRLPAVSLDDRLRQRGYFEQFLSAHKEGRIERYFIDRSKLASWLEQADAATQRASGIQNQEITIRAMKSVGPNYSFNSDNQDLEKTAIWIIAVLPPEEDKGVFFRIGSSGAMVKSDGTSMFPGEKTEYSNFRVPGNTALESVQVYYEDSTGNRRGPFFISKAAIEEGSKPFMQIKAALAAAQKKTVEALADDDESEQPDEKTIQQCRKIYDECMQWAKDQFLGNPRISNEADDDLKEIESILEKRKREELSEQETYILDFYTRRYQGEMRDACIKKSEKTIERCAEADWIEEWTEE